MPARQCHSIRKERLTENSDKIGFVAQVEVSFDLSYKHNQLVAQEKGSRFDETGQACSDRDRGANRENWERQTQEREVEW